MAEIKNDCFSYNPIKRQCEGLKELYCKNEDCKFYQNMKDVDVYEIERSVRNYSYSTSKK